MTAVNGLVQQKVEKKTYEGSTLKIGILRPKMVTWTENTFIMYLYLYKGYDFRNDNFRTKFI